MSQQCSRKEFVGLRGTPTPDGGMVIEIGQDPAGEGPVNVIPMFMKRPAGTNFAQAIELTDMGTFGEPKVMKDEFKKVLAAKQQILQGLASLREVNKDWWLMIIVRELEEMARATGGELPHDEGAMAALQEATQAVLDHMWALECQDRG